MVFKNEIESFCNRIIYQNIFYNSNKIKYIIVGKNNKDFNNTNIIDKLFICKPFEHPDGYYFNKDENILYIFEYFKFDCSPNTKNESKLRRSEASAIRKEEKEINKKITEITSIVEQGYCKNNTYEIGANGIEYRSNYISNFTNSFNKHLSQIEKYKVNCLNEINSIPNKIIITFICEDKTLGGTYYKKDNDIGEFINPLFTKQFINLLKNSKIDYLVFNSLNIPLSLAILERDIIDDKFIKLAVDLNEKELYIMPAFFKNSIIKYYKK